MVTLCWAAKGGSGTTVVATSLALSSPRASVLIDLDGEIPAVLGVPEPDRPGVADWLMTETSPDHLGDLLIEIGPQRWLLPWRGGVPFAREITTVEDARWRELGAWTRAWSDRWGCDVVIDAGTGDPPLVLVDHADRALLITRACYLSVRRAVRAEARPTGVVLVDEPGRALSVRDIERALGAPVVANVSVDPAIARAVDAGLLATRLPRVITRELRRVAA